MYKRQVQRLKLAVNLEKSKVIMFRNGGFLAEREKWYYGQNRLEVVNTYKYLGLTFSTRLSFRTGLEEYAVKAKKCAIELVLTLRKLGCNCPKVFSILLTHKSCLHFFTPQKSGAMSHTFR